MSIPFVDLKAQYRVLKDDVNQRIQNVLDHGAYIMGPEIDELETNLASFCGARHAITCSSGTDALVLALMAYGVGLGDAIFTTPFTFFATAESISLTGATPVFVDIDPKTFNIDPNKLSEAVTRVAYEGKLRIRGVMPVNLFGLAPDFDAINSIAAAHDMFVIEDTAQGFGGKYKGRISGSLGDISATSFFPAKPLGCYGDGGAVFTDSDELCEKMKSLRVHGQGLDKYDNIQIGLNARMDTIQAAVLLSKLTVFSDEICQRQRVAHDYSKALQGLVDVPHVPDGYKSTWAQYSILSDDRTLIQDTLTQNGIPSVIYYRIPCHLSEAYRHLGYSAGDMPVSEAISKKILSLPMHPYIEDGFTVKVGQIVRELLAS